MVRGRAVDDGDAAQGARRGSIPRVLTPLRNAAMRPVVRRPTGSHQKAAMRRCATRSIPTGIDRNTRLASRVSGVNATPSNTPTGS